MVISGRKDPPGDARKCDIKQEDFLAEARSSNITFRIPTPAFGASLLEAIPDSAIVEDQAANAKRKATLAILRRPHRVRITGTTNNNGKDGTIARFG